jgi:predicted dehydrogenase
MKLLILTTLFALFTSAVYAQAGEQKPVRIGIAGLTHSHVHWILGRPDRGDIEIVGIAEPNRALAERFAQRHGFSMDLVYDDLETMLEATQPEAVTAFNSIYGHLEVVEACAPRGIHVMVEKPLAVSMEHAKAMEKAAKAGNIHLLTNYETTWYGSTHQAFEMIHGEKQIGDIRKIVVHDGHPGPKEIGVNDEFLEWLTDPKLNGGGALIDFGCYGANLITWLMQGEKPQSVMAVTQQIKPHIYPKVDDEATIILTYPKTQGIIQASWNWPVNRKDMEVYGQTGYINTVDGTRMRIRLNASSPEQLMEASARTTPYDDPFAYLSAVLHGEIKVAPTDLSSLPVNMTVVEILDAARRSAASGKSVELSR